MCEGPPASQIKIQRWLALENLATRDLCLGLETNRSSIPKPIAPNIPACTRPGGWGHARPIESGHDKCSSDQ